MSRNWGHRSRVCRFCGKVGSRTFYNGEHVHKRCIPSPTRDVSTRPTDHPEDVCSCGDYRRDHPEDGPCVFNKNHGNGGLSHGYKACPRFELDIRAKTP